MLYGFFTINVVNVVAI